MLHIRDMSYWQLAMVVTHFNPSISQSLGDSVVFVCRSELFSCMISHKDSISYAQVELGNVFVDLILYVAFPGLEQVV